MPDKLFLRPQAPYDTHNALYDWALYDLAGQKVSNGHSFSLTDVEQHLVQNGVNKVSAQLFWPANLAFNTRVSLPGNQTRYIQQALPFAVEEQLSQDLEGVHLAIGAKTKQGHYPVACVDKAMFLSFFDEIGANDAGIELTSAVLDASQLTLGRHDMVICIDQGQALVRGKRQQAVTINLANLIAYLDTVFLGTVDDSASDEGNFSLKVFLSESSTQSAQLLMAEIEQYPAIEIETEQISISAFELLCESYFHEGEAEVNLCQGVFKVQKQGVENWRQWRAVAAVLLAAFVIQLGVFIGKGVYYHQQADLLATEVVADYKKIAPNSRRISIDRLPRIIKGKLNQSAQAGSTDQSFLLLLGEAAYQYRNTADKSGLTFSAINFNEQRGELVIDMQARNFEQLDKLKQQIVSAGLTAKISSAVQEPNYFKGRLSVTDS
jgi:general secretion pathway protein L